MRSFPIKKRETKRIIPIQNKTLSDDTLINISDNILRESDLSIQYTNAIPNIQDGGPVILRYRNLTINSGITLTPQYRCKGMIIIVNGDCVIDGTISMSSRGPVGAGVTTNYNMYKINSSCQIELTQPNINDVMNYIKKSLSKNPNELCSYSELPSHLQSKFVRTSINKFLSTITLPSVGGLGGPAAIPTWEYEYWANMEGHPGSAGTNRGCGGGGSGGAGGTGSTTGGRGGNATTWSGGPGGGSNSGQQGSDIGGPGGTGTPSGAGNYTTTTGYDGTGGVIILIVKGNLTINSTGRILANGTQGAPNGGSGSGGGSINIVYGGTYSNTGLIQANGGAGTFSGGYGWNAWTAGSGGSGCITIEHANYFI